MHFPVDLYIGHLKIDAHFVFETLAFVIGFRYFLFLRTRKADQISDTNRIWILIGGALGALMFSRLVGIVENPVLLAQHKGDVLFYYNNKTIIGGLLGGLLFVELTKKIVHVKTSSGDLFTFPIMLALIIGRIGCFLSGLEDFVYGTETSLPWGIDFGDGVFRHPVALYEILFLILLWIALNKVETVLPLGNGSLFKLFMVSYFAFRFLVEFIKPVYIFSVGFSTIQIFCLLGLLYYYKVFITPKYLLTTEP